MGNLTPRRRAWVEEYLSCWNATEAARRVGYGSPNNQGPRLLLNASVQEYIQKRIDEKAMSADEVLLRLGEHARGDMGDFLDISSMAFHIDMNKAKEKGITRLIKKTKMRTTTTLSKEGVETETHDIEIELYDAQSALEKLGKHHKLFSENIELGGQITIVGFGEDVDKL